MNEPGSEQAAETSKVFHDLKNVFTAVRSGCYLIEARLREAELVDEELAGFLEEMRSELTRGAALVDRLRG